MKFKKIGENKFMLILEKGEEIIECLKVFSIINNIRAAAISGIGALEKVKLAVYRSKRKGYKIKSFDESFEITNLLGNVTIYDNKPYLHIHVTLADKDFECYGGHLESGVITATCELIINVIDGEINRVYQEDVNLKVINL